MHSLSALHTAYASSLFSAILSHRPYRTNTQARTTSLVALMSAGEGASAHLGAPLTAVSQLDMVNEDGDEVEANADDENIDAALDLNELDGGSMIATAVVRSDDTTADAVLPAAPESLKRSTSVRATVHRSVGAELCSMLPTQQQCSRGIRHYIPITAWLPAYSRSDFFADSTAGAFVS